MPRICKVCTHDDRELIDHALIGGAGAPAVSCRFGVSESSVARHRGEHLPAALVAAQAESAADLSTRLHLRYEYVWTLLRAALAKAEESGDSRGLVAAVRSATRHLELGARMVGAIKEPEITVNVGVLVASREWVQLHAAIVGALDEFPDAAEAVAGALEPLLAIGAA